MLACSTLRVTNPGRRPWPLKGTQHRIQLGILCVLIDPALLHLSDCMTLWQYIWFLYFMETCIVYVCDLCVIAYVYLSLGQRANQWWVQSADKWFWPLLYHWKAATWPVVLATAVKRQECWSCEMGYTRAALWLWAPSICQRVFVRVHHVRGNDSPLSIGKNWILCQVLSGDILWMEEKNDFQIVIVKLTKRKPPSCPIHAAVEDKHWALMVEC